MKKVLSVLLVAMMATSLFAAGGAEAGSAKTTTLTIMQNKPGSDPEALAFNTCITAVSLHATVLVLNGIWIWNDYLLPLLILGKGNAIQTLPLAVSNPAGSLQ